ncbi:MAG: FAD-linked oxidase C-terminal domain-containing protein [Pseudolabrys sp.]|nr:FAD-linked oxidase C-terminal domain-containing protein [Pseudolabrys sp.]
MSDATQDIAGCLTQLGNMSGMKMSTALAVREQHGRDISHHKPQPPDAVVYPRSRDDVVAIVNICRAHRVPVIPYGAGTSLEGHISAPRGGVCVDMSEMNAIIAINASDLDAVVQPGVTRKTLNAHIRDTGLFFPIDPGADASIGGMAGTRASGTNAVRYGTMRENVLALEVVTADGRVIRTGSRARKSSAGLDLTRLFVGSEGLLGIFTELTVRLYGIPEVIAGASCAFETLEGAVNTTIATIQSGIPIARMELIDDVQVEAINRYAQLGLPPGNTLLMEFHGTAAGVEEQAKAVQAIAAGEGGAAFKWSVQAEQRTRIWQARHDAVWANQQMRPGWSMWPTDVCVPISQLADCILATKADIEREGLFAPVLGHVGDGNFHLTIFFDPADPASLPRIKLLNERLVRRALAMQGTCSGEHGIGLGKTQFMREEHGEAVDIMLAIKRALDPDNILNPGKMLGPGALPADRGAVARG